MSHSFSQHSANPFQRSGAMSHLTIPPAEQSDPQSLYSDLYSSYPSNPYVFTDALNHHGPHIHLSSDFNTQLQSLPSSGTSNSSVPTYPFLASFCDENVNSQLGQTGLFLHSWQPRAPTEQGSLKRVLPDGMRSLMKEYMADPSVGFQVGKSTKINPLPGPVPEVEDLIPRGTPKRKMPDDPEDFQMHERPTGATEQADSLSEYSDSHSRSMAPHTSKHICDICGKEFPRPTGLATHMNSHTGNQPFECPLRCGKWFSVQSNARRHLITHGVDVKGSKKSNKASKRKHSLSSDD